MSDSQIQVSDAQTDDNLTGLIIDGTPYLYWLRVYQALGLERHHAQKVVSRLTEGLHYRKFSKEEILLLSGTGNTVLPVDYRAKSFVFLTAEGYNRAIIEIRTCEMDDQEIAEAIDAKKDHIANIYTRYQSGEVLSLAADQNSALPGDVAPAIVEDVEKLKLASLMNSITRRMGAPRRVANKVYLAWIRENIKTDVTAFLSAIPDEDDMETPPDDALHTRASVAEILKVPVDDLEARMIQMGWVSRGHRGWHATRKGSKYLKTDPHVGPKGFVTYDVKFGIEAIHLLKREFEQQLFTGCCLSAGASRGIMPVSGNERTRRQEA